ncbi:glycosyltransferase [Acinetobacter johnsonii]|uniref:glycosyltransferase n=1 Tax=Acinetobacter johnsonii TaxID=40214 RepID=UPI003AF9E1A8
MRDIYFVVHSLDEKNSGGVLKATTEIANKLSEEDISVKIVSLGNVEKLAFDTVPEVEIITLAQKKYNTLFYKSIFKLIWFFQTFILLLAFTRKIDKSIFIATSPPLCMLFGLIKIYHSQNKMFGWDHTSTAYKSKGLVSIFKLYLYSKLDVFVALTPQDQQYYQNKSVKAVYIPNGIKFIDVDSLVNNRKYLLYVGRFSSEKRPLLALDIYNQSKLWEKNIKFRMFGSGPLLDDILDYIEVHNLKSFVEIISGINNPDVIYRDGYGLILTSSIEGFGLVLLEAVSRNIPCIAFDVPYGPRSIINNGLNGFLIPDNSTESAVELISNSLFKDLLNKDLSLSIKGYELSGIKSKWMEVLSKDFLEISE